MDKTLPRTVVKSSSKRASEIDYMLGQFKMAMSNNSVVTYDIENAVRRMR